MSMTKEILKNSLLLLENLNSRARQFELMGFDADEVFGEDMDYVYEIMHSVIYKDISEKYLDHEKIDSFWSIMSLSEKVLDYGLVDECIEDLIEYRKNLLKKHEEWQYKEVTGQLIDNVFILFNGGI